MAPYTFYPPHYPLVTQFLMQETKKDGTAAFPNVLRLLSLFHCPTTLSNALFNLNN